MDKNIKSIQKLCDDNGKELWPMVKTHKSSQIAMMQIDAGAKGFLVGTLDEAEKLAKQGVKRFVMHIQLLGGKRILIGLLK